MATIDANGGNVDGKDMTRCADMIDYWEQIDIYEHVTKHPAPRRRVIPFEDWLRL